MKRASVMSWMFVIAWFVFVVWTITGVVVSRRVEMTTYRVVSQADGYQTRAYKAHLEARVSITGSRSFALLEGGRTLTEYLRGDNTLPEAVAVARPKGVDAGPQRARIAGSAPLITNERAGVYDVSVALPTHYTIVTVPRPNNPAVRILQVGAMTVAVHGWRGDPDDMRIQIEAGRLRNLLTEQKQAILSAARTVRYGPVWLPAFLRYTEVYVSVREQE